MFRMTVVGVCGLLAAAVSPARAQSPVEHRLGLAVAAVPTPAPARLDRSLVGSARLGMSQPQPADTAAARDATAAPRRAGLRHRGPGVALMLVGAAGVVTGLLLEESIITVLGAGTGLVGLYLFLR